MSTEPPDPSPLRHPDALPTFETYQALVREGLAPSYAHRLAYRLRTLDRLLPDGPDTEEEEATRLLEEAGRDVTPEDVSALRAWRRLLRRADLSEDVDAILREVSETVQSYGVDKGRRPVTAGRHARALTAFLRRRVDALMDGQDYTVGRYTTAFRGETASKLLGGLEALPTVAKLEIPDGYVRRALALTWGEVIPTPAVHRLVHDLLDYRACSCRRVARLRWGDAEWQEGHIVEIRVGRGRYVSLSRRTAAMLEALFRQSTPPDRYTPIFTASGTPQNQATTDLLKLWLRMDLEPTDHA